MQGGAGVNHLWVYQQINYTFNAIQIFIIYIVVTMQILHTAIQMTSQYIIGRKAISYIRPQAKLLLPLKIVTSKIHCHPVLVESREDFFSNIIAERKWIFSGIIYFTCKNETVFLKSHSNFIISFEQSVILFIVYAWLYMNFKNKKTIRSR